MNNIEFKKPLVKAFLIKISSRCNLNCSYCYVYKHVDQSWLNQPKLISNETVLMISNRISQYVINNNLNDILIVFHGGEPLLVGHERIIEIKKQIENTIPKNVNVSFSMQTNAVLLNEKCLENFSKEEIGISVSLDGTKEINDISRVDHLGNSSFDKVYDGLNKLKEYKNIFTGIISVINPSSNPEELFIFFEQFDPPQIDFLLPDANYLTQPLYRDKNPNIYVNWLINAFNIWFEKFSYLKVRTFDTILGSIVGIPSGTDAFGFGDISIIVIETDGSYQDLDVLKITSDGRPDLNMSVFNSSIEQVLELEKINEHRKLLTKAGLSSVCQNCEVVDICAGGSVPHRFSNEGFINPSIYCQEMFNLISFAKNLIYKEINLEKLGNKIETYDLNKFESSEESETIVNHLISNLIQEQRNKLDIVLTYINRKNLSLKNKTNKILEIPRKQLDQILLIPSVYLWLDIVYKESIGVKILSLDNKNLNADFNYLNEILNFNKIIKNNDLPFIHRDDLYLRLPFEGKIKFEDYENLSDKKFLVKRAFDLINKWKSSLLNEIKKSCFDIQFIIDITADPDKIVSFSDNSVPGCIYLSIKSYKENISYLDIADSIIHESRHQKLYLLQREMKFVEDDSIKVYSPWREDPRPPSGLLHAIFVFIMLFEFWQYILETENEPFKTKALWQVKKISSQLEEGFIIISKTELTNEGTELVNIIKNKYHELNSKVFNLI